MPYTFDEAVVALIVVGVISVGTTVTRGFYENYHLEDKVQSVVIEPSSVSAVRVTVTNNNCWPQDFYLNNQLTTTVPAKMSRDITVRAGQYTAKACTVGTSNCGNDSSVTWAPGAANQTLLPNPACMSQGVAAERAQAEQQAREQQAREQQAREQQEAQQRAQQEQAPYYGAPPPPGSAPPPPSAIEFDQLAQQRAQEAAQLSSRLQNCVNAPAFKNGWIQYTQLLGVKALAIVVTSDGRCAAGWTYGGAPGALQSEANSRAISVCRDNSAQMGIYEPCRVYAEGHNIVWQ